MKSAETIRIPLLVCSYAKYPEGGRNNGGKVGMKSQDSAVWLVVPPK